MTFKSLTEEQELAILKTYGWETLWHHDNWIKKSWHKTLTNIDHAGVTRKEALERVWKDIDGNARYNEYINNHPTIHTNRFPTWDELREDQKEQWLQ